MKKKSSITFDDFLEKDPKFKKKFNKEFEKYQNRPKPNKKLKIGLKYIKKYFNLDLFLKKIEKYNYKHMDEGNMLDRIIQYGFEQDEVHKIYDHFDDTEFEKLHKLAEYYKLLPKITDNFKIIDALATETLEKWIGATLLSSKRNSTYYLFIDECNYDEGNRGNCLYFKSKDEKIVWNKMFKLIQKIDKENNPSKSTNIN
tara:strand:+ start:101 stop:700 length:600 start_codon:yes stop_codon:yes gene_type:complete